MGLTSKAGTWVVCCSTADWDAPLWTNKQHLMSRLGRRGVPVLYVDSPGLRTPSLSGQDARRIVGRLKAWRPTARECAMNVMRDSPILIPLYQRADVRSWNTHLMRWRLGRNRRHLGIGYAVLWTYTPTAVHLFDPTWHAGLVYHCVDDLAAYPGIDAAAIGADETELIRRADVCLASSRPLYKRLTSMGARRVEYWPNPADTGAYAAARRVAPYAGGKVVGFIGAVQEHKIDIELLVGIADVLSDCQFEIVGPVGLGMRDSTINPRDFPSNVHFRGVRRKEELPAIVAGFDVAIIPYRLNGYTANVFPMKVFEYLAAGVPVVSTPLPSLVGEVEHVCFASSVEPFADAVRAALMAHDDNGEAAHQRVTYASGFSWESRADAAVSLLHGLGARGLSVGGGQSGSGPVEGEPATTAR